MLDLETRDFSLELLWDYIVTTCASDDNECLEDLRNCSEFYH